MISPVKVEPALVNPYVGPRPFEMADRGRFFGRDREASELVSLIIAHRALLIYSASGAGKSSLINAEILPRLEEEEGFQVLPSARVRGLIPESITPVDISNLYVFHTLLSWVRPEVNPGQLVHASLADFLREADHLSEADDQPLPRVVIFDQFEDIFTSYPERWQDREDFFKQVRGALEADPLLRVVFAMREDYIAQMDPYSWLLPESLRIRFRLDRMGSGSALAAVTGPLMGTGRSFAQGVAETLVQELLKIQVQSAPHETVSVVGEFVEPVQLQVVCQGLWRNLPPDVSMIEERHLQDSGDVNQALSSYYEGALVDAARQAKVSEDRLRQWFDETLITSAGTRGTVFREDAATGGIPNTAVDLLEDLHLIRAEIRGGSRWYELTHDRFIEPIQSANESSALGRARRARRRTLIKVGVLASAITFVLLVVVTSIGYALLQSGRAQQNEELARARQLALSAIGIFSSGERFDMAALLSLESSRRADNNFNRRNSLLTGLLTVPPELVTHLSAHTDDVTSLAFSPDGSMLASGSQDNTIIRWDVTTGKPAGEPLTGHASWVTAVAFSPDSQVLVSGSAGNNVILWDATTGEKLGPVLTGPRDAITHLAFSFDGATLASVDADDTVILWDVPADQRQDGPHIFPTSINNVAALAFTQDGGLVAAGIEGRSVILWDVFAGRPSGQSLVVPADTVTSLAFSPNGDMLAAGSSGGTVIRWDADSGEMLGIPLTGHTDTVTSLAFSPTGEVLASGSADNTVIRWNAVSGEMLGPPLTGHADTVTSLAFNPKDKTLASGSADDNVILWDIGASHRLQQSLLIHADPLTSVAFSPDGGRLASGSSDHTIILWDVASGQQLGEPLIGHSDVVNSVAFSPDGGTLASGSSDSTINLWDLASDRQLGESLTGHTAAVNSVAFSPDGGTLASGSEDKTVLLWDLVTLRPMGQSLTGHNFGVSAVAFSPDGQMLASGSVDRTVILWDVATRQQVGELVGGHTGAIESVVFSPDGQMLASGSVDNTVTLWDVASRTPAVQPLTGHSGAVTSLAFSPDGQMLASGSADNTFIIWDVQDRQRLGLPFTAHADRVTSVAFSPDGQGLASASNDNTLIFWDISLDSWRDRACRIANRNLSRKEWERYLSEESYRQTCPG